MTHPIKRELAIYNRLREKLAEIYPDEDEENLADTLDGEVDLKENLAKILSSALDDESLANGAAMRAEEIKARITRFEYRAQKKRELVREVMEQADIRKIEAPDLTASMRKCPARLVITEEHAIPDQWWIHPKPKLDKKLIKEWLNKGQDIPGATLSNQPDILSVRTK